MISKSKILQFTSRIVGMAFLIAAIFCLNTSAQETPKAVLVDSFNYTNSEEGSARIDNFRNHLNQSPQSAGLVIVYGAKLGKKGAIDAHIRGIKKAFALKGIDHQRTPAINGGYREKLMIEFWLIPPGAETPLPSPTVDAKKVRVKGVSPKSVPYECCF